MSNELNSISARGRFKEAYRAIRIQHRFLIELDELIDRYSARHCDVVPWDKFYTIINDLYLQNVTPTIRSAVFYALASASKTDVPKARSYGRLER